MSLFRTKGVDPRDSLPAIAFNVASLQALVQEALGFVTRGKFQDASGAFQSILQKICVTVAETKQEADQVKSRLNVDILLY